MVVVPSKVATIVIICSKFSVKKIMMLSESEQNLRSTSKHDHETTTHHRLQSTYPGGY